METEAPKVTAEDVLRQLMGEARQLASHALEMSENAEPYGEDDPDAEPEQLVVDYGEMSDVRYEAKRVLLLLEKIGEIFPALAEAEAEAQP